MREESIARYISNAHDTKSFDFALDDRKEKLDTLAATK
jgi:hypothetical protein